MIFGQLPTDVDVWSDKGGILGLIILFLLVACAVTWKWLVTHMDKQSEQHAKERAEFQDYQKHLQSEHREERNTFYLSLDKLSTSVEKAIDKSMGE